VFTVSGLNRYVALSPPTGAPPAESAGVLVDELRAEIAKLVAAGPLAPAVSPKAGFHAPEFDFANPGDTLLALAEAYPYLDAPGREAAAAFGRELLDNTDPIRTESVPNFQGSRREYFKLIPREETAKIDPGEMGIADRTGFSADQRLDNVYALWRFCRATGDASPLRERWDDVRTLAIHAVQTLDWASAGHFRAGAANRGSAEAANRRFARWVAIANAATTLDDQAIRKLACAALARTALLRFNQEKAVRYMYDEKFQTVDYGPDWMLKLSTSYGESGPRLPWVAHWAGADDDVRTTIRWDEFGPVIGWMYGNNWDPVLVTFQGLTPEVGAFLHDHLGDECRRYLDVIELNAPCWHATRRPSYLGKENSMDSPRNAFSLFLAKCYALDADGQTMLAHQDIPFVKVGDLFHIRRLTANLGQFGRAKGGAK